ncbi:TPA: hypothetical protein JBF46_00725 [Legionella pneumophila]|uniref:Uncharacterized protein n=2 Tax=Legionella londiniensis TaxID=45068 RepID=A0A0W0VL60_9GAMM|nr:MULTISPECIES: hypothetical protein [Legionella]KTD20859.1 hypothetical protein Llon_1494 [Legionella londiniensis]STX92733.1 Uncharacterised protein [Legionella londiniensis]STX92737.1 Uncharacterised protein [Legionella londiniensis]STX92741.1 Uncharacterised protein [Legionella londiniensis]HAT3844103.1 hypothetical protein [Legionella pneumophila]
MNMNKKIILQLFKEQMLKQNTLRNNFHLSINDVCEILHPKTIQERASIHQLIDDCVNHGYLEPAKSSLSAFPKQDLYTISVLGLIKLDDE